jgi:hypothetical protein
MAAAPAASAVLERLGCTLLASCALAAPSLEADLRSPDVCRSTLRNERSEWLLKELIGRSWSGDLSLAILLRER